MRQKIADQMRQQVSQMAGDMNGAMQDLNSLIESMGARDVSVTRSRFTHAKTLQFAQVSVLHYYLCDLFSIELRFAFVTMGVHRNFLGDKIFVTGQNFSRGAK